jgi:hypothetical protein
MWYIFTMENQSVIKNNEMVTFRGKWKKLEIIMLSETSQTQKDKYHMVFLMYRIYILKKGLEWKPRTFGKGSSKRQREKRGGDELSMIKIHCMHV